MLPIFSAVFLLMANPIARGGSKWSKRKIILWKNSSHGRKTIRLSVEMRFNFVMHYFPKKLIFSYQMWCVVDLLAHCIVLITVREFERMNEELEERDIFNRRKRSTRNEERIWSPIRIIYFFRFSRPSLSQIMYPEKG